MRFLVPAAALVLALAPAAQARGVATAPERLGGTPYALVGVKHGAAFMAAPLLRRAGAVEVSPTLELWRLRTSAARRLLPALRAAGAVSLVQPDGELRPAAVTVAPDPLTSTQWWRSIVGADRAEPPGPGVHVTVIDTGVDLNHPEFAGRPGTVALNQQRVTDTQDDYHGTAVASVVGAPANGVGLVGIYPQANLEVYDADLSGRLTDSELIAGIETAAARGRGVLNLSLGSTQFNPALQAAIFAAIRSGVLVVAASGNSRDDGNPINFPANMSHVLTVAATDQLDRPASFSSSSLGVDLAAPGVDIPVALPTLYTASGFTSANGTSFSAPMVAGAAAWIWTARPELDQTQLFDVMRWSARDVGETGFDVDTGFGVLDVPNALSFQAPPPDPAEPNDDVILVKPGELFREGTAPLTTPTRGAASLRARVDVTEDPEDVYRVWIPAGQALTLTLRGNANVDLEAWRPGTRTISESGSAAKRDLAGSSQRKGIRTDSVKVRNVGKRGAYFYADVFLGRNVGGASYTLNASTASK